MLKFSGIKNCVTAAILRQSAEAAKYPLLILPALAQPRCRSTNQAVLADGGRARTAREAKPKPETKLAAGKMWEPRLKSQRVWGRDCEAGSAWREGTEKKVRAAMPPEARRDREMLNMRMKDWAEAMLTAACLKRCVV